jgi:hypothetical protein
VENSKVKSGIGFDHLPDTIKNSKMLTHRQLIQLAGVNEIPMINPAFEDERLKSIVEYFSTDPTEMEKELHLYAATLLDEEKVDEAWQVLLTLTDE